MSVLFSLYEAKARLSEIIRLVRNGRRVTITYRGKGVAQVVPMERGTQESLEQRLSLLEQEAVVTRAGRRLGSLAPVARRPGALKRFLEDRE